MPDARAAAPLSVVIVDDEAPARNRLKDLLADAAPSVPNRVVGEAASGGELIELLAGRATDLVLLDIRMPGIDGIEAARHLQLLPAPPRIIFTTAYDVYAVKAFELHAVDYLLKPIRLERLVASLARVRALVPPPAEALRQIAQAPRSHIAVPERGRLVLVPVPEILFMRAELKYVTLRTAAGEHLLEESLTRLEQEFGDRFLRIHRACLVARAHLAGFERAAGEEGGEGHWYALLKGSDERLPVSRRQAHVVREFVKGLP